MTVPAFCVYLSGFLLCEYVHVTGCLHTFLQRKTEKSDRTYASGASWQLMVIACLLYLTASIRQMGDGEM